MSLPRLSSRSKVSSIQEGLGGRDTGCFYCEHHSKLILSRVRNKTHLNSFFVETWLPACAEKRQSLRVIDSKSHYSGFKRRMGSRGLFLFVFGNKGFGGFQAGLRTEDFTIQDGVIGDDYICGEGTGLDGIHRYSRCLSTCSDISGSPSLFKICSGELSFPGSVSLVLSLLRYPEHFRRYYWLIPLPGRPTTSGSVRTSSSGTCISHLRNSHMFGWLINSSYSIGRVNYSQPKYWCFFPRERFRRFRSEKGK